MDERKLSRKCLCYLIYVCMLGLGEGRMTVLVRGKRMCQDVTERTVMKESRKMGVDTEKGGSLPDKAKEVGSGRILGCACKICCEVQNIS